ncbi:MAG TPA: PPOX class F420-dependent oxidoreductase [Solirubrobacteraceae bacterium]|jgi:hypothetical protein
MKRLVTAQNRLLERLRAAEAFRVQAQTTGFEHLRGHKYALLVSYRRSGEPVPTAVWFGLTDGRVYVRTETDAGKVKRIRREPRVLIAPCDFRAKPRGPAAEGRARVLDEAEFARAEAALQANYGVGRRVFESTGDRLGVETLYLEVAPV